MTWSEYAPITVSRPGSTAEASDAACIVVWLRGEHDLATRVSVAIARATRRDDADLLVDLSEVIFMDASTVGVLIESRNRLRARSRSLLVRAPSTAARRVLELCGPDHLVHSAAVEAVHPPRTTTALRTEVDTPSVPPSRAIAEKPVPVEQCQRARLVTTADAPSSPTLATLEVDRNGR